MICEPLLGQTAQSDVNEMPRAEVPWGPGENLTYQLKLGLIPVGEAYMRVEGLDTVRGFETYKFSFGLDASMLFGALQVHDRYDSWLDTRQLVSRRFVRDIHELKYKSHREYEIFPEEGRWERTDVDAEGETPGFLALDEISLVQFTRTLQLQVGDEYTLHRYFEAEHNPVIIKVLRKERIEVPAGTFDAIVVQPIINTDGLFSEGGQAELYFTDDEHRHLIYLRSRIPVIGALSLLLTGRSVGLPLSVGSEDGAQEPGNPPGNQ